MDYSYTIERASTKQRYMRVRYESEGRTPILKALNPTDFSEAALRSLIDDTAAAVVREWEAQDAMPDDTEADFSFDLTGGGTYVAPVEEEPEPTPEELVEEAVNNAAALRAAREASGILWSKDGSTFYLDTTIESQNRFSAARIAVEAGERVDGAVWKLADVTSGAPVLTFRPTTNAEISEMAGLVHDFVQKCFQAEANTVQKIFGGDLTASFETEFDAL
ncbi:MAG: hypothetical protein HRU11_12330 [Parvularculaceae bacterium]|nr:hypothetical protein [Parvularculaceae bacterium]